LTLLKKAPALTESQKGKVAQDLLALALVIGSHGQINVALPTVDDEAVDIIFYLRGESQKALFTQVKSRWLSSQGIQRGTFRTQVRKASFHPRDNYCFLFAVCDEGKRQLGETLWVVPSTDFSSLTRGQSNPTRIVFQSNFDSNDMWSRYRLTLRELPSRILELLTVK
jgi:hypothetical protein